MQGYWMVLLILAVIRCVSLAGKLCSLINRSATDHDCPLSESYSVWRRPLRMALRTFAPMRAYTAPIRT
jgi:hypothetical protein